MYLGVRLKRHQPVGPCYQKVTNLFCFILTVGGLLAAGRIPTPDTLLSLQCVCFELIPCTLLNNITPFSSCLDCEQWSVDIPPFLSSLLNSSVYLIVIPVSCRDTATGPRQAWKWRESTQ